MKPIVLFRISPSYWIEEFLEGINNFSKYEKDNFLFLMIEDDGVRNVRKMEIEVHNIKDATEETLEEFKQYIKDNYPDADIHIQG